MSRVLIDNIRNSIIGGNLQIPGPFGSIPVVYADYTASGRALTFVEDFIRERVLPFYANTHTETSATGRQTTAFRESARAIIHRAVGGNDSDVVIFCGSGATGAINKIVHALNLDLPPDLDARFGLRRQIPEDERPVVFVGPYEHHSNELPWRESIADVVVIDEDRNGQIDLDQLEGALVRYDHRPLRIGSFSAASNVTGIRSDTVRIAALLHKHGALSFWDYAAAGPYVDIDMNPGDEQADAELAYKDAVFLSPHKFVGGPGTPGVLVVKKHVLLNRVPSTPGGGTVSWVSPESHQYSWDASHREEGGTPAIVESIRAGLVFQLKEAVGVPAIETREHELIRRAISSWGKNPNIIILGDPEASRLAILSFAIRHDELFLHHNFVVALLNDLFGIQARGGCSCAGPYGHRLLGIDQETSRSITALLDRNCPIIKPGWTRLGFNYFIDDETFEYMLEAVHLIAEHGWKLLPQYEFDPRGEDWRCRNDAGDQGVLRLEDLSYVEGTPKLPDDRLRQSATSAAGLAATGLTERLQRVRTILEDEAEPSAGPLETPPGLPDGFLDLQWFWMPSDVVREARGGGGMRDVPDFLRRLGRATDEPQSPARQIRATDPGGRRVLVIRHEDWKTYLLRSSSRKKHRNLGNFELPLRREHVAFDYLETPTGADLPIPLKEYSHLIVLGGRMGAYEDDRHGFIRREMELIEDALSLGLSVLGVCLGAQLLARVLGAEVSPGQQGREVGWTPITVTQQGTQDALMSLFPTETRVFQWHDDTFDLPPEAVLLARSEQYAHQAFRYGKKCWGLQFHLEVNEDIIRQWMREEAGDTAEHILAETDRLLPPYKEISYAFIQRLLQL